MKTISNITDLFHKIEFLNKIDKQNVAEHERNEILLSQL